MDKKREHHQRQNAEWPQVEGCEAEGNQCARKDWYYNAQPAGKFLEFALRGRRFRQLREIADGDARSCGG